MLTTVSQISLNTGLNVVNEWFNGLNGYHLVLSHMNLNELEITRIDNLLVNRVLVSNPLFFSEYLLTNDLKR